jgi:hypothetical protein
MSEIKGTPKQKNKGRKGGGGVVFEPIFRPLLFDRFSLPLDHIFPQILWAYTPLAGEGGYFHRVKRRKINALVQTSTL